MHALRELPLLYSTMRDKLCFSTKRSEKKCLDIIFAFKPPLESEVSQRVFY